MHKLNINFQRPGPALATWWYWKEKWEAAVNVWNQWILKRESKPGPKQSLFLHNLLVAAVFPRCCLLFVRGKPRAWPGLAVASVTREAAQPWINPSAVLPSLHEGKKALNSKKQNKLLQYNSDIILICFFFASQRPKQFHSVFCFSGGSVLTIGTFYCATPCPTYCSRWHRSISVYFQWQTFFPSPQVIPHYWHSFKLKHQLHSISQPLLYGLSGFPN